MAPDYLCPSPISFALELQNYNQNSEKTLITNFWLLVN